MLPVMATWMVVHDSCRAHMWHCVVSGSQCIMHAANPAEWATTVLSEYFNWPKNHMWTCIAVTNTSPCQGTQWFPSHWAWARTKYRARRHGQCNKWALAWQRWKVLGGTFMSESPQQSHGSQVEAWLATYPPHWRSIPKCVTDHQRTPQSTTHEHDDNAATTACDQE